MALSEYEKQVLEQMEAELRKADPGLSSALSRPVPKPRRRVHGARRVAIGVVGAVVGLGVILAAVTISRTLASILVGVVGFALMVAGVLYALGGAGDTGGNGGGPGPRRPRGWDGFMSDQERRWDSRRGRM